MAGKNSWKTPNVIRFHHKSLLEAIERTGFQFALLQKGTFYTECSLQSQIFPWDLSPVLAETLTRVAVAQTATSSWVKEATWFCWTQVCSSCGAWAFFTCFMFVFYQEKWEEALMRLMKPLCLCFKFGAVRDCPGIDLLSTTWLQVLSDPQYWNSLGQNKSNLLKGK